MTEITLEQFTQDQDRHIQSVVGDGNIISVETERGKMVLMEEAEYKIMRQALVAMLDWDGIVLHGE